MKHPFLLLTLFALSATTSFAGGPGARDRNEERGGFQGVAPENPHRIRDKAIQIEHRVRDGVAAAWDRLKGAGRDVRDGVYDSVEAIKNSTNDLRHERPFLMSEYVTAVKKGKEVTLIYCESRLKRVAKSQRCEKLHNGSFKIDELKTCLNKVDGDKQPGMILNRNLKSAASSEYEHDHFKMYDSKDNYREYLTKCQAELKKKPTRVIATRPAPLPPARPAQLPEFKPLEAPAANSEPPAPPAEVSEKL